MQRHSGFGTTDDRCCRSCEQLSRTRDRHYQKQKRSASCQCFGDVDLGDVRQRLKTLETATLVRLQRSLRNGSTVIPRSFAFPDGAAGRAGAACRGQNPCRSANEGLLVPWLLAGMCQHPRNGQVPAEQFKQDQIKKVVQLTERS